MTDITPETTKPEAAPSRLKAAWDSDFGWAFRHSPIAIVSAIVVLVMVMGAVLAPLIAPFDPLTQPL